MKQGIIIQIGFIDPDSVFQIEMVLIAVYCGEDLLSPQHRSGMRDITYLFTHLKGYIEAHQNQIAAQVSELLLAE